MTDNNTRMELFSALQNLTEIVPEMRTGQLVAVLGELCNERLGHSLWDATDAELLAVAGQFQHTYESATATM